MAALAKGAGLPPGALNVVPGEGFPTGDALSRHPGIDKISFTGSVATGQRVMEAAARTGPHDVHLELGGKSAMVVFDDVEDVEATVDWACVGVFANSGQVCRSVMGAVHGVHARMLMFVYALVVSTCGSVSGRVAAASGQDCVYCVMVLYVCWYSARVVPSVSASLPLAKHNAQSAYLGKRVPPTPFDARRCLTKDDGSEPESIYGGN